MSYLRTTNVFYYKIYHKNLKIPKNIQKKTIFFVFFGRIFDLIDYLIKCTGS